MSGADFLGLDTARAVALQPDGKIVVAGDTIANADSDIAVARFNPDGSVDATFDPGGGDGDGKKKFGYAGDDHANAILVQPDGKIVIAGFGGSNTALAVTRLNPDGSFDKSFDGDGTSGADFGGIDHGYAAALQPDGKIVVAGDTSVDDDVAVARLNPNGSLDTSFNGTGTRKFGYGGNDSARAVLVQPDGKIVLAGIGRAELPLSVARLNPDGSFDTGFGGDGTSGLADFAGQAAALQPDGKIVVVGHKSLPDDVAVARFQPGGAPDTTFSSDGKTTLDFGGEERGNGVALQPDGRIVVVGWTDFDSVAARLQGDPRPSGGGGAGGPGGGPGGEQSAGAPRCAGRRATIVGTARRDVLRGTRRADVIVARGGRDVVRAGRGNDVVCGGAGNDLLRGGSGSDRLLGQSGRERLRGGAGRDRCAGGRGRDRARCEIERSA